jgi:hypothetical protein
MAHVALLESAFVGFAVLFDTGSDDRFDLLLCHFITSF